MSVIDDIINIKKQYSVNLYSVSNDRIFKRYITAYTSLFSYPDIIQNINRSIDSAVNSITNLIDSNYKSLSSNINKLSDKIRSNLNQIKKNADDIKNLYSKYNSIYNDMSNLKSNYNSLIQFKNRLTSSNMHTYIHNIYTQIRAIRSVIDKQLTDIKNAYDSIHISMSNNIPSVISDIRTQFSKIEKIPLNLDINYYSLFNMYSVENELNKIHIPDFVYNPKIMYDFMGIVSSGMSKVSVKIVDVSFVKSYSKSGLVNPAVWLYYYLMEAMYNRLNQSVTFAKEGNIIGMAKSIWLSMVSMKVFADMIMHINAGNSKFEKTYYFPLDSRVYLYVYADNLKFIYPYKKSADEIKNLSSNINSKVTKYIKDLRNATLKIPKSIPTKVNLKKDIWTGINANKIRNVDIKVELSKRDMVIENLTAYIKQLEDRVSQLESKLKEVGL